MPVSFSALLVDPVVSNLSEPYYGIKDGNIYLNLLYYDRGQTTNYPYRLNKIKLTPSVDDQKFNINGNWLTSLSPFSYSWELCDALDGKLLQSSEGQAILSGVNYQFFIYNNNPTWVNGWYLLAPDIFLSISPQSNYSDPFITWSIKPIDHNIYHSSLSEPVADDHNAYFIINKCLYWCSYRINTIYVKQGDILGDIENYSGNGSYNEEHSVVYNETGTVSWNNDLRPTNSLSTFYGVYNGDDQDTFLGIIKDLSSNSYGLGVSLGDGTFSYNGSVYVPASYSSSVYSEPYELCLTLNSQQDFNLNFLRHSSLNNDILIDADCYLSIFNLSDGQFLSSEVKKIQGSASKIGWSVTFQNGEIIEDIKMFGPAFINVNNIPVNLSDVIWQYDLEFVQWRDSMLAELENIYNLLASSSEVPETTTYRKYGEDIADNEPNFSNISSDNIKDSLDDALADVNDLKPVAGVVRNWINDFIPPKVLFVLIFALAFGVVLLILGKNKDD